MTEPKINNVKPTSPKSSISIEDDKLVDKLSVIPSSDVRVSLSVKASIVSDRVRKLLDSLEGYDSLYLCPIKNPFPDVVANKLHRRCVHKYEIKDYFGQNRFYAAELTPCCNYFFCSDSRSFQIFMYDLSGELVFESIRNCNAALCIAGADCCCSNGVETTANFRNDENYIGSVLSNGSCTTPIFRVQNEFWDEKYFIRGPKWGFVCPWRLCFINQFFISLPKTFTSVGKIVYGYDGLQEDRIPNPKTVGIIFPPRCSSEIKACLLTAGFMLDVTYFQKRGCTVHRIFRCLLQCILVLLLLFGCFLIYFYGIKE